MKPTIPKIDKKLARKILSIVDKGLVKGIGEPVPGEMCVEAAVCYAWGLDHSDEPPCVGEAVRHAKIALNDTNWSSSKARAKGLRKLAIAQLGSDKIDQERFMRCLIVNMFKKLVTTSSMKVDWDPELLLESDLGGEPSMYDIRRRVFQLVADMGGEEKHDPWGVLCWKMLETFAVLQNDSPNFSRTLIRSLFCNLRSFNQQLATKRSPNKAYQLACDACLKALIECGSPGCKYLSLCDE
jgi:hypothetical protein